MVNTCKVQMVLRIFNHLRDFPIRKTKWKVEELISLTGSILYQRTIFEAHKLFLTTKKRKGRSRYLHEEKR